MDSFAEYRELVKTLTAMKIEYQDASPSRQSEIDTQYKKLYQQGREIHQKSISLALDAHDEAPNRNPYVNNLLYLTVGWEFSRENYEESIRVFKRLAASGIDKAMTRCYVYAGLSAMLSMNYAEAEEWLVIAGETDELKKLFADWSQSSRSEQELLGTIQSQMRIMPQVREAWTKEQAIRAAETAAGEQDPAKKLPRVELLIGKDRAAPKGKVVLELFENESPNTVANFVSLVEKGFYNNVVFHRVLANFMAQGGDPTGSGRGGPGYTFDCETGNRFPQARKHFRGSISMANAGPNTNGSQFFLTFVPTSFLDGRHTVFGCVVEGFEVLADIQRVDPADEKATIPELDRIIEAKVLNKRDHAYEVKRNAGR
jgi:cyclophilin family peptidyl-prolyl cis-trans isomerase